MADVQDTKIKVTGLPVQQKVTCYTLMIKCMTKNQLQEIKDEIILAKYFIGIPLYLILGVVIGYILLN